MRLKTLHLQNFRKYRHLEVQFHEGINLLYGPNASGKTTFLEAIALFILGKSFRTSRLLTLVHKGAEAFFLRAFYEKAGDDEILTYGFNGKDRHITHNGAPCSTTSTLLGNLQGVVFTPDDIGLTKDGPALRRRFLDMQIAQTNPLYIDQAVRFHRAIQHRNILLKKGVYHGIEEWEQMMAQAAAYICSQRRSLISLLEKTAGEIYHVISGKEEHLSLNYQTFSDETEIAVIKESYLKILSNARKRDSEIGYTRFGPHRDDLLIDIDQLDVRLFASEGQQRSCVAALKLAEWKLLGKRADDEPLLLLDDIGVSLDPQRQKNLFSFIQEASQVLLTGTEAIKGEAIRSIPMKTILSS